MREIDWKNEYSDEEGIIYLRPMTYDDAETYVNWRNSESVNKYFIYRGKFTVEGQKNWIRDNLETGKAASMMVCLTGKRFEDAAEGADENEGAELQSTADRAIGNVYLLNIDNINKKAEYGVMIGDESIRGKGLGTKIAKLMLKYAFDGLGLHRVYLRALEGNDRAVKSYMNAGFKKEGFLVDDVCIDGEFKSVTWMAAVSGR
ncbi:MAG: GNAT family N-acetyltransferase [Lachnospiraceae bacterium]|nr:GNAT family N-acetyltransferase [Lachnospiraceae bacterium]